MTAEPEAKRSIKHIVGEKLYSVIFRPGWPRWVLLAGAALVFLVLSFSLSGGPSYKDDPSALVPRSVQMYMETRDLDSLLRTVSTWKVWKPERRSKGDEQRNQLQVDLAGLIGEKVAGLGTRLPLQWIIETEQAAYCINTDDAGEESWALFLRVENAANVMADIGVEAGMTIETVKGTAEQGVYRLTGTGAGELYFGLVAPWLIVSSGPTLPEFAMESSRRPAFSLSRADLLPGWRRGIVVRGVGNPGFQTARSTSPAYGILSQWMDPDVRVNFTSKIGRRGLETTCDADLLTDRVRGGGLWSLVSILLGILALLALAVVVAIVLVMIGWGGWLKAAALRAGIAPAQAPEPVRPSEAFRQDSGASHRLPGGSGEVEKDGGTSVPSAQESKNEESVQKTDTSDSIN